jgi:hypothetical protein
MEELNQFLNQFKHYTSKEILLQLQIFFTTANYNGDFEYLKKIKDDENFRSNHNYNYFNNYKKILEIPYYVSLTEEQIKIRHNYFLLQNYLNKEKQNEYIIMYNKKLLSLITKIIGDIFRENDFYKVYDNGSKTLDEFLINSKIIVDNKLNNFNDEIIRNVYV